MQFKKYLTVYVKLQYFIFGPHFVRTQCIIDMLSTIFSLVPICVLARVSSAQCDNSIGQIIKSVCVSVSE